MFPLKIRSQRNTTQPNKERETENEWEKVKK
jgi:hypothetical protein